MSSVPDHYARLLAPIYLWMAGGPDAALTQGAAELADSDVQPTSATKALDLGAGFGMHTIPLARLGYSVTAIDTSPVLLSQLRQLGDGLDIRAVQGDLLDFPTYLDAPQSLILCMGDTLTHLSSTEDVDRFCSLVADFLLPGGRFLATFRDYTRTPRGDARFIPVRSDSDRIHMCFLEEAKDHVLVHDIVHERQGSVWSTQVSHYPKLRLDPERVVGSLERLGLTITRDSGPRGMVRIAGLKTSGGRTLNGR